MEKMLVTQGLNELKTLESRIFRAIESANFVAAAKTNEKKVSTNTTKEEFEVCAKASMDSITALINRREKIKTAIVESNAKTMVEICGEQMSIAKVIDTKNSIDYRKRLLEKMKQQYSFALNTVEIKNNQMENKLNELLTANFGKDNKATVKTEEYDAIAVPFRKANEYSLVDPCHIKEAIEFEERYIEEFTANVDQILQVSNCTTYIEF